MVVPVSRLVAMPDALGAVFFDHDDVDNAAYALQAGTSGLCTADDNSSGTIWKSGDWLQGKSNQLFSDRWNGSQPFNVNAADNLDLYASASGVLWIYYKPWNFWTSWDMKCQGNFMTSYIPGHGVVTLAFRSWSTI